jgi:hypothetical protein
MSAMLRKAEVRSQHWGCGRHRLHADGVLVGRDACRPSRVGALSEMRGFAGTHDHRTLWRW